MRFLLCFFLTIIVGYPFFSGAAASSGGAARRGGGVAVVVPVAGGVAVARSGVAGGAVGVRGGAAVVVPVVPVRGSVVGTGTVTRAVGSAAEGARYYDIEFSLQDSTVAGGGAAGPVAGGVAALRTSEMANYSKQAKKALKAAKQASLLYNERAKPASSNSSLLLKAKGDYANILAAMQNFAFYGSSISITIDGKEAHNIDIGKHFAEHSTILVVLRPGPLFKLHNINIVSVARGKPLHDKTHFDETLFLPYSLELRTNELAKATVIKEAQRLVFTHLAALGYMEAKILHKRIIAKHKENIVDIDILIDRKQKLHFANLTVVNTTPNPRLDPALIAYFTGFVPGQLYTPKNLEILRHNLESLDLFNIVVPQVSASDKNAGVALKMLVSEKPLHNISAGLEFASRDGLGINASWLHRNLFGHGERLALKAASNAIGVGYLERKTPALATRHYGYDFTASFDKPGIWHYNAHNVLSLRAWREYTDYYNTKQLELRAGIYKPLSEKWLGSAYLSLSNIYDVSSAFGMRSFHILGLDTSLSWDKRDNSLSPSHGGFLNVRLNPFYASGGGHLAARMELEGRSYLSLDRDNNYVFALRGKWGAISGADLAQLPLSMQYFAGGAGTIRGYSYKSIGSFCPARSKDSQCEIGGQSIMLASAELRANIWHKWGVAGFVDSGYVGTKTLDFNVKPKTGIGVGLRYNSRLGPLRVDFAHPLNAHKGDSRLQLYLGIGEVF